MYAVANLTEFCVTSNCHNQPANYVINERHLNKVLAAGCRLTD